MEKYNIEKIINFLNGLASDLEGEKFHNPNDGSDLFLHGGCYDLYKIIKDSIPEIEIKPFIKKDGSHVVFEYDGVIYDAHGIVPEEQLKFYEEAKKDELEQIDFGGQLREKNINLYDDIMDELSEFEKEGYNPFDDMKKGRTK